MTTCPEGQLLIAAWIRAESTPPLGESVAHMVVRLGTPPLDIIPGFQAKFLFGGIICPSANCAEKRLAKIRTDAPSIPDDLKCEIRHFILCPPSKPICTGYKPCLFDVIRSSDGQQRGDPVVVFGPGRGMEGRDLAYKRRNCGTCAAPRCGLSGDSLLYSVSSIK
jgi:hypothetical protein